MEQTLNQQQRMVFDTFMNTNENVFCTGHGGTGKSWVLKCICNALMNIPIQSRPRIAITAPTAAAALDIGGVTLNRFAGVGIETENVGAMIAKASSGPSAATWKDTDVLVIDEISMVSGIFFSNLDIVARHVRDSDLPFGGIRLLILGDFLQLPPISKFNFRPFRAFECQAWKDCNIKTILLTETVRQADTEFVNILHFLRMGVCNTEVNTYISRLSRDISYDDSIEPVRLYALRRYVDAYNGTKLDNIRGRQYEYHCKDTGTVSAVTGCSAPSVLTLKRGAQVMIIRNISNTLVNGTIGVVKKFVVRESDSKCVPVVETVGPGGHLRTCVLSEETWECKGLTGNIIATRRQFPLILAWAITIHKSQGKSIPRLHVDMKGIFEVGQAYVALSRCESVRTLQVVNYEPTCVKVDTLCAQFYNELGSSETTLEAAPPAYSESTIHEQTLPEYEGTEDSATNVANNTTERWEAATASTQIMMGELSIRGQPQETSETLEFGSET